MSEKTKQIEVISINGLGALEVLLRNLPQFGNIGLIISFSNGEVTGVQRVNSDRFNKA